MSAKCRFTESVISTVRKSTPSSRQSVSALDLVRTVVPKQGMVTAMTSRRGRPSRSVVRTMHSSARQESNPPEMPTTSFFARAACIRVASPSACMVRISSQRRLRSALSSGTKGCGSIRRVSTVSTGSSEKYVSLHSPAVRLPKVFMRRRSNASRCTSISVISNAPPDANGARSARTLPFSAIMECPEKTVSVVDSPCPQLAYR